MVIVPGARRVTMPGNALFMGDLGWSLLMKTSFHLESLWLVFVFPCFSVGEWGDRIRCRLKMGLESEVLFVLYQVHPNLKTGRQVSWKWEFREKFLVCEKCGACCILWNKVLRGLNLYLRHIQISRSSPMQNFLHGVLQVYFSMDIIFLPLSFETLVISLTFSPIITFSHGNISNLNWFQFFTGSTYEIGHEPVWIMSIGLIQKWVPCLTCKYEVFTWTLWCTKT